MTPTLTGFRKPHRIEPVATWLPGGTEYDHHECWTCSVEVRELRDGSWRHNRSEARSLPVPATWPR